MQNSLKAQGKQSFLQKQTLAPQMRQSLEFLSMNLQQLKERLQRELEQNPAINYVDSAADERTITDVENAGAAEEPQGEDWLDDDYKDEEQQISLDEDSLERRRHFFDSHAKREESLEEHLRAQIGLMDIGKDNEKTAEILIGSLDGDGRFKGSFADLVMVTGAREEKLRSILREIMKLDPPGCGATTVEECLIAQLDRLEDSPYRDDVELVIKKHLKDLAERNYNKICEETGISEERLEDILKIILTLEPHPGRAYSSDPLSAAYIYPEIRAVKDSTGRWIAKVDDRDLPEIHISPQYRNMLKKPNLDPDTKEYLSAKLAAVEAINESLAHRYDTISLIAQAIFDSQSDFFEKGLDGLVPMTMEQIADKTGVHRSTVSRTVNGKYAKTPHGTFELRAFFKAQVTNSSGEEIAKGDIAERIQELVDKEDKTRPLSDEAIAEKLKGEGFNVARRTIAKYRSILGVASTRERKSK